MKNVLLSVLAALVFVPGQNSAAAEAADPPSHVITAETVKQRGRNAANLEEAFFYKDMERIRYFLEQGERPNANKLYYIIDQWPREGWGTPAERTRRKELVKLLLEHEAADVNFHGPGGRSVLARAIRTKDKELVTMLVDHGADVNDKYGSSSVAAGVVGFTSREKDAEIGLELLNLLIARGLDLTSDKEVLFTAVRAGANLEIIDTLLSHGVDWRFTSRTIECYPFSYTRDYKDDPESKVALLRLMLLHDENLVRDESYLARAEKCRGSVEVVDAFRRHVAEAEVLTGGGDVEEPGGSRSPSKTTDCTDQALASHEIRECLELHCGDAVSSRDDLKKAACVFNTAVDLGNPLFCGGSALLFDIQGRQFDSNACFEHFGFKDLEMCLAVEGGDGFYRVSCRNYLFAKVLKSVEECETLPLQEGRVERPVKWRDDCVVELAVRFDDLKACDRMPTESRQQGCRDRVHEERCERGDFEACRDIETDHMRINALRIYYPDNPIASADDCELALPNRHLRKKCLEILDKRGQLSKADKFAKLGKGGGDLKGLVTRHQGAKGKDGNPVDPGKALIMEHDIGEIRFIETTDDGGEAAFLSKMRTGSKAGKELEGLPVYSGVYRIKKSSPKPFIGWQHNKIAAMVQDYKEDISDGELSSFLEARIVHHAYEPKQVDRHRIYILYTEKEGAMYFWRSSDKLIVIYPLVEKYFAGDMAALAKAYLEKYPSRPLPEGAAAEDALEGGVTLKEAVLEVKTNLLAIREAQVSHSARRGAQRNTFVGNQPLTPVAGRAGNNEGAEWDYDTRFSLIGFSPRKDVRCSYALEGADYSTWKEGFTARAECDLDGDGSVSIWKITDDSLKVTHSGAPF